jgi:predicted transposase YdaD
MENHHEPPFNIKKLDSLLEKFLGSDFSEKVGKEQNIEAIINKALQIQAQNIAKKMYSEGVVIEIISNVTGLSQQEIKDFI